MKAILEFVLPDEQIDLQAAIKGLEWRYCLEEIVEHLVACRDGTADLFPGRPSAGPVDEMQPVLDFIKQEMASRGLHFDP